MRATSGIFISKVVNRSFLIFFSYLILSCTGQSPTVYKIGVSQPVTNDAWRQAMIDGMHRQLNFHDDLKLVIKDAEAKTSRQITQIQELVDEGVDLLIVSPNESEAITPIIESVYQKGIPVIVLDRRTTSDQYTAFIGADNKAIGADVAAYIATVLLEKGNVLELVENQNVTAFLDRHEGFQNAIDDFANIKVDRASVKEDQLKTYRQLIGQNKYDVIFGPTDVVTLDAFKLADNLDNVNKKSKFIGIDGLPGPGNGIEMVSNGVFAATFLYPTGGEESIEMASKILKQEPFEKENILNSTVIDRKNVRVMKLQSDKILSQQKDIKMQQERIDEQIKLYSNQRTLLYILMAFLVGVVVVGALAILAWREKSELNKSLEIKKAEIEEQRDKIAQMAEVAEKANQEKINFFTNISHEFKTPLTLLLGPIDSILANLSLDRKQLVQHGTLIRQNALRLLRLINQLMDFRKIEDKKMILQVTENDLISFVENIMTAFNDVAKKRKILFELNAPDARLPVFFDPDMLDKVIFNLLSNAFKFTQDKGTIVVSVTRDATAKNVVISVEDHGAGMSQETEKHAFDQFFSSDNLHGTGLGLSLSKELVELHHGKMTVSTEKGKGTRFSVLLPLGNEHFSSAQIAANAEPFNRNSMYDILVTDQMQGVTEQSEENTTSHEFTILLIEDHNDLRKFLKDHLSKNYNVEEASNGNEGIRMAFETVPDIIISDIMLPGKSGFEVIQILKNDLRTSHIPTIILTAKGNIDEKIAGIQTGADEYITKPFVLQFLNERIKALIKNRETLREHYSHDLHTSPQKTTPAGHDKKFINDFKALVEKNISNANFNVNEIGPELAMSRVQVYRKVKALMGCSVNDYINGVRLKRAQFLLLNTSKSISDISFEVGFSSPNYFATIFKSNFNQSPKEFKSSRQGKD
jgi:signal transduction histidine kinase/DNA-binding response OmpR family regulator